MSVKASKVEVRIDGASFSIDAVDIVTDVLSWMGVGGKVVPFIQSITKPVSLGIAIFRMWHPFYKSIADMEHAPLYIDRITGKLYYGDPDCFFYGYRNAGLRNPELW